MKRLFLFLLLSTSAVHAAPSLPAPAPESFTPRQLYVSCSLMISGDRLVDERVLDRFKPAAPATCGMAIMAAMSLGNKQDADEAFKFCAKGTAAFDADILKSTALTYVEFYEANAAKLNKVSGFAGLLIALQNKWPCE